MKNSLIIYRIIAVLLALGLLTATPPQAASLSSADYRVEMLPHYGGAVGMSSASYRIQDMKGQSFYSPFGSGTYGVWPGLYVFLPSAQAVVVPPLAIVTDELTTGEVGSAYSEALYGAGGVLPYTWSIASGSLPAGLNLNSSSGVISGTPTAAGTEEFYPQITDAAADTATRLLTIEVFPERLGPPVTPEPLAIVTEQLAPGEVGTAYSQTLYGSGGQLPYIWSIAAGNLPAGLFLSAAGGQSATIEGTPTTAGTVEFYPHIDDAATNTTARLLTIEVFPVSQIALVDSGWIRNTNITREGQDLRLTWDYDPALGPTVVRIYVLAGAGAEYVAVSTLFGDTAIPNAVPSGTRQYLQANAAFDGNNYYYRVVPDPLVAGTDVLDPQNNSITVGKVEIAVPANQYDFIALPFMEDVYYLSDIIGEQLGDGAEYYFWDTATQTNPGASYASGQWGGSSRGLNTPLRMGDGFYVRAMSARTLALVGRFGRLSAPLQRTLVPKNDYNLIGFPYPFPSTLAGMGLQLDAGADVYEWTNYTAYRGSTYLSAQDGWSVPGIDRAQLSRPRFYRPISNLTWEIDP